MVNAQRVSANGVSFGFGLPQDSDPTGKESVAALARAAEEAGFQSVWTSETPNLPALDPLPVLASAAAVTEHVQLGVGVLLLPLRIPVQLARDLGSLEVLSSGRLVVGVGFGRKRDDWYAEYGLTTDARLRRHLNALNIVKRMLEDGTAAYGGPEWTITGAIRAPQFHGRQRPPFLIGARNEQALRRAVHVADGWLASASAEYRELVEATEVLTDELAASGRSPESFPFYARLFVLLNPTSETRARVEARFEAIHPGHSINEDVMVLGDVDLVRERIDRLRAIGVEHVVLNPLLDFGRHLAELSDVILHAGE